MSAIFKIPEGPYFAIKIPHAPMTSGNRSATLYSQSNFSPAAAELGTTIGIKRMTNNKIEPMVANFSETNTFLPFKLNFSVFHFTISTMAVRTRSTSESLSDQQKNGPIETKGREWFG